MTLEAGTNNSLFVGGTIKVRRRQRLQDNAGMLLATSSGRLSPGRRAAPHLFLPAWPGCFRLSTHRCGFVCRTGASALIPPPHERLPAAAARVSLCSYQEINELVPKPQGVLFFFLFFSPRLQTRKLRGRSFPESDMPSVVSWNQRDVPIGQNSTHLVETGNRL